MSEWMRETLHGIMPQALRVDNVLYDSATEHQRLRVFENAPPLRAPFSPWTTWCRRPKGDNFIYHEMLTHVPILAHGSAREILIIGGGDGGMAREALRHENVTRVTMVEIDAGVVEFSRQYSAEALQRRLRGPAA